jgi:Tfp pilus assembly protein PilF
VLSELEDRGLLGWERRANRYDLHPIVRGVVWSRLTADERQTVLQGLEAHYAAQPMVEDWQKVETLADLEPAIERYDKLIGLERYQEASALFYERIDDATLYRLSAARSRLEMLRGLFPDGEQALPRLGSAQQQSWALNSLAAAYQLSGKPGLAAGLIRGHNVIREWEGDQANLAAGHRNLSSSQRLSGVLYGSEASARRALGLARDLRDSLREAVSHYMLGNALAARGVGQAADLALKRAIRLFQHQSHPQGEGTATAYHAELVLHQGQAETAQKWADRAWVLAAALRHESDFIRAARLQGTATLQLDDLARADERLHHALQRARAIDHAEEELPALVALAELRYRQGDPAAAREYLEQVWDPAERGPYPLFHADALNVLAQIERDAGNIQAAIDAATEAYRKSWCDGPPYAYHWGLEAARKHLRELGAPEPEMLPFDLSKHEPMPEVEIKPASKAKRKSGAKGKKSRP